MRRVVLVVGAALTAACYSVAPASGATQVVVPPVVGSLTCGLTGAMTFAKPLPNSNSGGALKITHVKIKATISDCAGAVSGGKAPITGGTLLVTGLLAGR